MKQNKYTYNKVIQANYGYGWDDLISYNKSCAEDMKEFKRDLKDYKANERAAIRVINRRISNN